MSLKGKLALITGSARGLGKSAALALAREGCDVAINYMSSKAEADRLAEEIRAAGVSCAAFQADIRKREELERMVRQAEDAFGASVDILINNAGPFVRERKTFAEYTWDEVEHLLTGNLTAAMALDHLVLPGMRRKQWGRIIHFGFAHAAESRGWPHRAVYAAAKVGLVSFTKTLAVEEAEHGITVNMICPGDVRGENKEKSIAEVRHLRDPESPRGRPGSGEDIARVVVFLCQDLSDFVTGNIIEVGGGLDPIRTLPLRREP